MLLYFTNVLGWIKLFGILPWLGLTIILSLLALLAYLILDWWKIKPHLRVIVFALAWCAIEWLRSLGKYGLSWGELGASQIDSPFAVISSVGGISLISFLMLLFTGYTVEWLLQKEKKMPLKPIGAAALLLLCLLLGQWQTDKSIALWRSAKKAQQFALIQPSTQRNLTPEALVKVPSQEEINTRTNTLINLSLRSLAEFPEHNSLQPPLLVWPESAIYTEPEATPEIFTLIKNTRSYLICGAVYFDPQQQYRPKNSAYLISPKGQIVARYSKVHLVPFGEFVPLRSMVEIFYTVRDTDISPGDGWHTVSVNTQRLGIGICFESAYDYIARNYVKQRANYLVYITNDSWFKDSPAIRQHFNHARFRALESGLPVVRVASSGISGAIAPNGHIISEIALNVSSFRTIELNAGTAGTIFSRIGWLFPAVCCVLLLLVFISFIFRRKNGKIN